jgi:hypothetical protein
LNYYSVFDVKGTKIADCGSEKDAKMLADMVSGRTYRQIKLINPQTVSVAYTRLEDDKQLPAQQILPQSELEPFIV